MAVPQGGRVMIIKLFDLEPDRYLKLVSFIYLDRDNILQVSDLIPELGEEVAHWKQDFPDLRVTHTLEISRRPSSAEEEKDEADENLAVIRILSEKFNPSNSPRQLDLRTLELEIPESITMGQSVEFGDMTEEDEQRCHEKYPNIHSWDECFSLPLRFMNAIYGL